MSRTSHVLGVFLLLGAALGTPPTPVRAEAEDGTETGLPELPPSPEARPQTRVVEVNAGLVGAFANSALCPPDADCILGGGFALGFTYEWRRPSGFTLGLGYDLWILGGGTVWDASTLQDIRFAGRYLFLPEISVHPYLLYGAGVVGLGDLFRISTAGAALDAGFGVEWEITESLAFTFSFELRTFMVVPFTTHEDGVQRGQDPMPNMLGAIQLGIVIIPGQ